MSGDKPVVGAQGAKYGLILPKAAPKQPAKVTAVKALFSIDDEPEEEIKDMKKVMLEAQRLQSARLAQAEEERKQILAEDPTAFDYDSVYDHMKNHDRSNRVTQKKTSAPLYIDNLLAKAEERKRQADLVYEKKLQREVEAEKELFGETEAFVTPAYKEKLEENRRYEEEQKRKEAEDEKRQASGKKDMSAFYSNLLTNNVAFGTKAEAAPPSRAASSSSRADDRDSRGTDRKYDSRDSRSRSRSRSPRRGSDRRRRSRSPRRHSHDYPEDIEAENRKRAAEEQKRIAEEEEAKKKAEAEAKKYAKRNVGELFDQARERYFKRVAERKNSGAHAVIAK